MRFLHSIWWLLKGWFVSFCIFGLLGTLLCVQFAWSTDFTWSEVARLAFRDWFPWAVVSPFLFLLVAKLPLFSGRAAIAAPAHLMCAMATFAMCTWWSEWVEKHRPPPAQVEESEAETAPPPTPPRLLAQYFFLLAFRLPVYLAILSAAHALYFYRRSQARERHGLELEAGRVTARLEALQMQLQPHFLFNSLNAIAALIHKDPEAADEMVAALSDFLRLTLESRTAQELPLFRELEFVERYLAIEKVRFGDRLQFAIHTPMDTLHALVPALVLQPLVENAVHHGLEPKVDGGWLTISAKRDDDLLILSVSDDGAGLPQHPPREGIGLVNTRARLSELYGDAAKLEMSNGDGVEVRITLPYHTTAA